MVEGQFRQALEEDDILLVSDITERRAVGFAWGIMNGAFGRSPYLRLIGVHSPTMVDKRIGQALLSAMEPAAYHTGRGLMLLVSDFNTAAQSFYQKQGYQQVGALPGYVLPDVMELIYLESHNPKESTRSYPMNHLNELINFQIRSIS